MATEIDNQQAVYSAAMACNVPGLGDVQAKIIMGQASLESGNFGSNVFKQDNNCFGLKYPSKRPTTYIDGKSTIVMESEGSTPYCHYNTLQRCVQDLILGWHASHNTDWTKIITPEQYAAYLVTKDYFPAGEATAYAANILGFMKKTEGLIKSEIKNNPGTALIGLAIVLGIGWLIFK